VFAALLKAFDHKGPAEIEPKRAWTFRQVHWLAHRAAIPLDTPARHPFNPIGLSRLWGACVPEGGTPGRFACEQVLRHVWRGGAEADDPARLAALAAQLAPRDDPASDAVKQRLRASTDDALARGVFGVPTLGIDDKLFWGFDALDMAAACVRADPWFDAPHWQREGAPRAGVKRP
jgi:2-hydroxychromene-2-carboxylate isomerase